MIFCWLIAAILLTADGALTEKKREDFADEVMKFRLSAPDMSDQSQNSGEWILIQHKKGQPTIFETATWKSYKAGFGSYSLQSDFYWRGLERIHKLTSTGRWQLLMKSKWTKAPNVEWAVFNDFKVDGEIMEYRLHVGSMAQNYQGTKIMLAQLNGHPFSTHDRDNDPISINCADDHNGGWWFFKGCYNTCYNCNNHEQHFKRGSDQHALETLMAIKQVS